MCDAARIASCITVGVILLGGTSVWWWRDKYAGPKFVLQFWGAVVGAIALVLCIGLFWNWILCSPTPDVIIESAPEDTAVILEVLR